MATSPVLVAEFPDAHTGRAAVLELERRGVVGAERVQVEGLDTVAEGERRTVDGSMGHFLARRSGVGALAGTALGALLGAVVALVLDLEPTVVAVVASALGGALFLGAAGFFYSTAVTLPVTADAVETSDLEGHPVRVLVHLDRDHDETAVRPHLEAAGATRVDLER